MCCLRSADRLPNVRQRNYSSVSCQEEILTKQKKFQNK